jgi:hypothetical protein
MYNQKQQTKKERIKKMKCKHCQKELRGFETDNICINCQDHIDECFSCGIEIDTRKEHYFHYEEDYQYNLCPSCYKPENYEGQEITGKIIWEYNKPKRKERKMRNYYIKETGINHLFDPITYFDRIMNTSDINDGKIIDESGNIVCDYSYSGFSIRVNGKAIICRFYAKRQWIVHENKKRYYKHFENMIDNIV